MSMKVIFARAIVAREGGVSVVQKVVNLAFAPWVQMEVNDPVLHRNEPRFTVQSVTLSLGYSDDEPSLRVWLGDEKLGSPEEVEERIKVYKSHGWEEPG